MVIQKMRQSLLDIERMKRNGGGNQIMARADIARSLGVSLATVENIIRLRVKSVGAALAIKINSLKLQTIEAEHARLENERRLTLEFHRALVPDEMDEVETLLETARERLRKLVRKGK